MCLKNKVTDIILSIVLDVQAERVTYIACCGLFVLLVASSLFIQLASCYASQTITTYTYR